MRAFTLFLFITFALSQSLVAESVPFEICAESTTWTRPTPEVQAKIWKDSRYGDDARTAYDWTHDFLVSDPESASIPYHMANISGLWTARTNPGECHSDNKSRRSGFDWIEVWVLLHRIKQIRHDNNTYTITVAPTGRGFQSVLFRRLNPSVVLRFVTPDGRDLEKWDESAPPQHTKSVVGVELYAGLAALLARFTPSCSRNLRARWWNSTSAGVMAKVSLARRHIAHSSDGSNRRPDA